MKILMKFLLIFVSSFLISACAAGNIQLPERYNFAKNLEEVKGIYKYLISEWEQVDRQSLIIRTGIDDYYLLILDFPSPELPFRNSIRITSTGDMIRPGYDEVFFYNTVGMKFSYSIKRIYRIQGEKQMRNIRDWLEEQDAGVKKDKGAKDPGNPGLTDNKLIEI
jgi:hypothetical protein